MRIPARIATIAQNSVVLSECFVSVVSRATTPGRADKRPLRTASVATIDPFLWMRPRSGAVVVSDGLPAREPAKPRDDGGSVRDGDPGRSRDTGTRPNVPTARAAGTP